MNEARKARIMAPLFALALIGSLACNNDTVSPDPIADAELSAETMADLALEGDGLTEAILIDQIDAAPAVSAATSGGDPIVTEWDFSLSRSCPLGGEVSVDASFRREFDPSTTEMEATFSGTRSRDGCTFRRGEFTVTVDGSATLDVFRRRVGGFPDGPQTTRLMGSFTAVRSDGEQRSCEFDIEIVRDPGARERTLSGMICGDSIFRSVSWGLQD